ncbi:MAG: amino acid ABC transporter substrate-binding protein, partial [Anaerolineae bacterium]|nr:amino acid ABC transporter substrate-binding protein [Anaerolineae bacterium]
MAARPWRVTAAALVAAILVWVYALTGTLLLLRWLSVERPGPPIRELFPYGELRVGVDASYPPFAVATADDLYGFDIDLGRALGERLGIPVRFVNMGYDGLYDSLRIDQVDVLLSALLIDPTRTNDVLYTIPYYNAGLVLVSGSTGEISAFERLPGHSLALEFGSDADLLARTWLRRVQPFTVQPYELPDYALDALRLGRADAALVDATSARLYLREHDEWNTSYMSVSDALYAAAVRIDRWSMWA